MNDRTHRRRFAAGVFLGLLVGVALLAILQQEWKSELRLMQKSRTGIVLVQSLAEVVSKALNSGGEVQPIIAAIVEQNKSIAVARVVQGVRLEASTAAQDRGDKATPRRLAREEKYIFDQGQRLRASVLTNKEEGTARKDEIEITEMPSGGLSLAAPLEKEGAVIGFVQIETSPLPPSPALRWWIPLAFIVVPFVVFLLLASAIGEKRALLAVAAFGMLAVGFAGYALQVRKTLGSDRRAVETAVAQVAQQQVSNTQQAFARAGLTTGALDPSAWDVDIFRRPRGMLTDRGAIQDQKLNAATAFQGVQILKAVAAVAVLSLLIAALVGFGAAAKLWATFHRYREAYAYTAPAMIGMLVLVFFPFIYGIAMSFTDANLYNSDKPITDVWIGLKNYVDILGDFSIIQKGDTGLVVNYQNFYWTLFFNIVWTVSNVAFGVTVGLILALILNTKGLAMRPLYRVLLIFPWAMPNYITALIWRGMFHQQFGVINQVVQLFGGSPISWFEKPTTSFFTAFATNGWLSFPFMMVVSLGALQSIPADLYEAARVDGATRWQQFKSITLPSLRPALVPAIILSVVWTFNMFNIIFLVTAGEPGGATEILITQAYKIAFQKYRYGYAAAYSTVIFIILLIYGTFQNKATKATEAIS